MVLRGCAGGCEEGVLVVLKGCVRGVEMVCWWYRYKSVYESI